MWSWETVVIVSWHCHCCLHVILRNFCCPLHLLCPLIPQLCWHNRLQGHTMSKFKELVRIKNNSKGKRDWGFSPGFFIFNLHEFSSLVRSTSAGAATSVTEGASPSSLEAGKGQEGLPFLLPCFCCPAQSSFRNEWDCYITGLKKLHLSIAGEIFFWGILASFWLWEFGHLRSRWVVQA